jgi:cyclopropane-fatty-acyl-phospholipid synthase
MGSSAQDNTNNTGASLTEIQAHYDVGNEFYKLWLDKNMIYSCALWEGDVDNDLEQAQLNKLRYHIESVSAQSKHRVLDIGCGWGGILQQLTQVFNVKQAVGLTLSEEQAQWIRARNMQGVEVCLEAWQDHTPAQPYDGIISIGAFEHFARPDMTSSQRIEAYRAFFEKCASWLEHRGRLSLQTIAHGCVDEKSRKQTTDMAKYVFPGSELPRLQEIIIAAEDYFKIEKVVNHARDYFQTCQIWKNNLKANKQQAIAVQGEQVYQFYVDYLQNAEFGFGLGKLALYRLIFEKPPKKFF